MKVWGPSSFLASLVPFLLPHPFSSLLLSPQIQLQGLGERCKLPQQVLTEPDCQIVLATFLASKESHSPYFRLIYEFVLFTNIVLLLLLLLLGPIGSDLSYLVW